MFSKILIFTGISLMLIAGGISLMRKNVTPQTAFKSIQHAAVPKANATPIPISTNDLTNRLDSIADQHSNLDIGVSVIELGSGQTYEYGDKLPYYGASTTKVLVAAMYLHEVETGKRKLSDKINGITASAQITAMIEQSDNDAWSALLKSLGYANIDAYARSIGIASYTAKDNLITAPDMALILQKLYSKELLGEVNTALLLGHMQKSIRNYIAPAFGSEYTVYHKAGWLEDRLMDTAIVTNGSRSFVLVIFSKTYSGYYDFAAGASMFADIAKGVNDSFNY
ncbi:hypothetical protein BH10PAT3_BH10PAT3_1250 [soil metagenome]